MIDLDRLSPCLKLTFVCLALSLLGATDVESWLRTGNGFYARGEYAAALDAYARAAEEAEDPGQVAFAQAAAHYQLGQFSLAQQAYQRALEDAEGQRRLRALYGLGNALARHGQQHRAKAAVERLQQALAAYKDCVAQGEQLDPVEAEPIIEAALHNYQQVEALLLKKRAEPESTPEGGNDPNQSSQPNGTDQQTTTDKTQGGGEADPQKGGADQPPRGTNETQPGKGNLPPLPDAADAPAIDPQRALDHLRSQMDRIRKDRSQRRSHNVPPSGAVRDW